MKLDWTWSKDARVAPRTLKIAAMAAKFRESVPKWPRAQAKQ